VSSPEEDGTIDQPSEFDVPATGDSAVDDALRLLGDLRSMPLAEHHDRLARAHEALHRTLERSGGEPDPG
jgi:hypothetical protein